MLPTGWREWENGEQSEYCTCREKSAVIDSDGFSSSKDVQTEVQPPGVLTGD